MLRASFPGLAASAAANAPTAFAAVTIGSLSKKTRRRTGALSSLKPLNRPLVSASPAYAVAPSSSTSTRLAALSSRDPLPPPPLGFRPDSLTGRWKKVKAESDDMRAACDAVELNRILRAGVSLVNTLDLADERLGPDAHFATTLKAGGVLDVRERYPWSGAAVEHSRRDKRRGRHSGRVSLVEVEAEGEGEGAKAPEEGPKRLHPRISVTWDDPLGGECTDTFVLSPCGRKLTQLSVLSVRGKEAVRYKTVFAR